MQVNNWNDKTPEFVQRWISQHITDAQVLGTPKSESIRPWAWFQGSRRTGHAAAAGHAEALQTRCCTLTRGRLHFISVCACLHSTSLLLPPNRARQAAGKPLLLEEFGVWSGDGQERTQYYRQILNLVQQARAGRGPFTCITSPSLL